jgi:hypothetical protein
VSKEYPANTTQTGSLMFGVQVSSEDCELGWITSQGQSREFREFLTSCLATPCRLWDQRVSGHKSGMSSYIEDMTVALFAQMKCLVILSALTSAVAVRCPLRFCTQCRSFSFQTDVSEKTLFSGHWATWHIAWCPIVHHGSFTLVLTIGTRRVETVYLIG